MSAAPVEPGEGSDVHPPAAVPPPDADVQRLLEHLRGRDVACPACGYNLRDLASPACPECREALHLSVSAASVRIGWLITAAAPGIFCGIAAALLAVPIIYFGNAPSEAILIDLFGWVSALVALCLLWGRQRFMRQRRRTQLLIAAVIWAVHIGAFATMLWPAMVY